MTNSNRARKISLLIFGLLVLDSASWSQKCPPAAEKIAQAYGIDSFGQIDAVRSTFNIDFPGLKVAQSWTWEPKADRVTYEGKDKAGNPVKITYVRSQLSSQPDNVKNEIDPSFNNNQYWLFLPFHACWDTAANVEDSGMHKLPIGAGSARRVVMTYPPEGGGYTPGDTWELYVGPDNLIQQLLGAAAPGSRLSSTLLTLSGWITRRSALCFSPWTIAGQAMASRCGFSLRMWRLSWQVRIRG